MVDVPNLSWDDVGGLEKVKMELLLSTQWSILECLRSLVCFLQEEFFSMLLLAVAKRWPDQLINISLPDETSELHLFRGCLRKSPVSKDLDLQDIVRYTEGFSSADITEIPEGQNYAIREDTEKDIERKS
ncbi:hypothetical protein Tsubulata_013929 [Turnera subulata]|uniref:AAA ATPase AAA+ lid domain-containing protein n=1 Tax=Turnera subulata TaxID=218843 RepID=A0A9Q0FVU2_9ROSI|nr:hypothetical protein Tsubulata_013929 [Turnera subulata]